jgi:hypothetical protein
MIAAVIVCGAAAFALAFTAAYLVRPELRAWIEQPKHRFQSAVQQYDRDQVSGMHGKRSTRS